jgi:hypothetical protein
MMKVGRKYGVTMDAMAMSRKLQDKMPIWYYRFSGWRPAILQCGETFGKSSGERVARRRRKQTVKIEMCSLAIASRVCEGETQRRKKRTTFGPPKPNNRRDPN